MEESRTLHQHKGVCLELNNSLLNSHTQRPDEKLSMTQDQTAERDEEVTHPSFDGGYSHSSPFGKSPLGYSSQIGTEGGSVCPLAVAQIERKEKESSSGTE